MRSRRSSADLSAQAKHQRKSDGPLSRKIRVVALLGNTNQYPPCEPVSSRNHSKVRRNGFQDGGDESLIRNGLAPVPRLCWPNSLAKFARANALTGGHHERIRGAAGKSQLR